MRRVPWPLLRVFLLAAFGVLASAWALVRAYRPRPPMLVPLVVDAAGLADASTPWGSSELVAPDLLPVAPEVPPASTKAGP